MTTYSTNINVGIMGHVDAGKTTLARFISTQSSTAAFDKNPQSQTRGITLDIGFSSTMLPSGTQVTLVDCPGHASLFKMVIGAAQIIDAIILVIDAVKGPQIQTAECLVLAEIVTNKLMIALTKVDLINESERDQKVDLVMARLRKILQNTKFPDAAIVPVSERIPGSKEYFLQCLQYVLPKSPTRDSGGPTIVSIDHSFTLKGHGAILTGTVVKGKISVNDLVEVSGCKGQRTVRSIQSFRQAISNATQGDRIGISVGILDTKNIERAILAHPGVLKPTTSFLITIKKVKYYKFPCLSRSKTHISILHDTVLATAVFLKPNGDDFEYLEELPSDIDMNEEICAWVESPKHIIAPLGFLVLGTKLDIGADSKTCRIAFYGKVLETIEAPTLIRRRIYRWKQHQGLVDRVIDDHRVIGKKLASKDGGLQKLLGKDCSLESLDGKPLAYGIISSTFGTSGKFNVALVNRLITTDLSTINHDIKIIVRYKKYLS